MPGHEQVEGAFGRVGVAHQTPFGPDRVQHGGAAGDQLVGIDLMAGVPDQAVLGEVEGQVQGQAELDHAEVAGEVGRPPAHDAYQLGSHLVGELIELRRRTAPSDRPATGFAASTESGWFINDPFPKELAPGF